MPDAPAPKPVTLDIAFAKLILGYLSTPAAIAAGMPTVEQLPRVHVFDNKAKTFPLLVIAGSVKPDGTTNREVTVVCALHSKMAKEGEPATREDYAQIMATVETLLHDQPAIIAYIQSLPEDAIIFPTGTRVARMWPGTVGLGQPDREYGTETIPCDIRFKVRVMAAD